MGNTDLRNDRPRSVYGRKNTTSELDKMPTTEEAKKSMGSKIALSYCLEDYKAAKAELLTTIDMQFKVLSILVTATAAVFVYLLKRTLIRLPFVLA